MSQSATVRLLRLREVQDWTGLSKSQLYALERTGQFARRIKIGRSSRWPSDRVQHWIDERIAEAGNAL